MTDNERLLLMLTLWRGLLPIALPPSLVWRWEYEKPTRFDFQSNLSVLATFCALETLGNDMEIVEAWNHLPLEGNHVSLLYHLKGQGIGVEFRVYKDGDDHPIYMEEASNILTEIRPRINSLIEQFIAMYPHEPYIEFVEISHLGAFFMRLESDPSKEITMPSWSRVNPCQVGKLLHSDKAVRQATIYSQMYT